MSVNSLIDEVLGGGLQPPPARGRKNSVTMAYMRDLTEADVKALWDLPEGGLESTTPALQHIKSSHHMLARVLADGKSQEEASIITGYSISRISLLKKDPAFHQLLEYYKGQVERCFVNVYERLASLGIDSLEELQRRLDEKPDDFTLNQLMELAELTLDRSGAGPQTKNTHQHLVALVDARSLEQIKDEVKRRETGNVITLGPSNRLGLDVGRPESRTELQVEATPGEVREGDDV